MSAGRGDHEGRRAMHRGFLAVVVGSLAAVSLASAGASDHGAAGYPSAMVVLCPASVVVPSGWNAW